MSYNDKENRLHKDSDFLATLSLVKCNPIGTGDIPANPADYNFDIEVATDPLHPHLATKRGKECKNCEVVGDEINIFFDAPDFEVGKLRIKLTVYYPDDRYTDGVRQTVIPIQCETVVTSTI